MSTDSECTFASWEGVERLLARLRSERDNLESFFSRELEEFDTLRAELVDRSGKIDEARNALNLECQQLEQRRRDLEQRQREIEQRQREIEQQQEHVDRDRRSLDEQCQANELDAESLEDKSRRLAEANAELEQVRAKLSDEVERSKTEQQQPEHAWHQRIEQLEEDRKRLSEQLATAEEEAGRAAKATQTLDELRVQFEAAQAELVDLRSVQPTEADQSDEELKRKLQMLLDERVNWERELEAARAEAAGSSQAAAELSAAQGEFSAARQQIDTLREQLTAAQAAGNDDAQLRVAELEEDRTALELELEAVRNQSAQLADSAAKEKRQAAEERAQWAAEFKQFRQAMETQAETQARFLNEGDRVPGVATGEVVGANGDRHPKNTANGRDDPMLDSLMDQFQQLQKERIRRRANARVAAQQEVA